MRMSGRFNKSVFSVWVKAIDLVSRIDFRLTGAYYRPSPLGALLITALAVLFLPLIALLALACIIRKR